jgi:dihydropteroate synthase
MLRGNTPVSLRCGSQFLDLSAPVIMGIMNTTPDSFYPESRVPPSPQAVLDFAGKLIGEGAAILDIGGMSTRPGAEEVEPGIEIERVIPAIEVVKANFPETIISLDTYRTEVAAAGIVAGATMINDISGGELDKNMFSTVAQANVAYVLMHMRGRPQNMQSFTDYEDLMGEVLRYFVEKLRILSTAGATEVILDPGFGFSKTMQQNYQLIDRLDLFRMLERPVMVGVSRKSSVYKTIGKTSGEALEATSALHMAALMKGARILRVHDVGAASDVIKVYQHLLAVHNP